MNTIDDPKSLDDLSSIFGILKLISQGENDVRDGAVKSQENVFNDLEKSLKAKLK